MAWALGGGNGIFVDFLGDAVSTLSTAPTSQYRVCPGSIRPCTDRIVVTEVVLAGCEECVIADPSMFNADGPIGRAHLFKTTDAGTNIISA